MILQVQVVAVVVAAMAGAVLGWPIEPLDSYIRSDERQLEASCGGVNDVSLDTQETLRVTFNSSGQAPHSGNCTFHLRLAVKDLDIEKYGLVVEGSVDLEEDNDCTSSYLTIADEDDLEDEMGHIDKFCGKQNIDFHTTEDIVAIQMKLRDISTHEGYFSLIIKPKYLCGGLVDVETEISTPEFPESYPRGIMCLWEIKAPKGFTLSLNFEHFDMRPSKSVCKDYVGIKSDNFITYCGKKLEGKTMEYNSHEIVVVFRSDKRQGTFKGFNCNIKFMKQMKDMLAKFFQ